MPDGRDRKDMLLEAGLTLASELSLPMVLQRIVDLAVQVTDARYGALGVIGENETLVEFVTTGIGARQRRAVGSLPTGRGVLGLLIHEPRPVRLRNIADHPQSVGFPANHPPMRSFLGAPVQALGRVFGNIYLAEKRSADEFSQEDEESLVVLATQAGVAIANASLYEEVRSREQWLDALSDITTHVLGGGSQASLLDRIAEHARGLSGAAVATVMTAGVTPGELVVSAAAGARAAELRGQTMPAEASVAMDYDRAQLELRRLGLLEERERIAKELHDGIIQSLFAVGMSLQGTALTAANPETSARIERAVEELDGVIRDLRNYIFGLRPGILADRQLDQALRNLGEEIESRASERVEVVVDAALAARLSSRSADIVQLTREALSNVVRHARASRATVRLERNGAEATLTIEDDGAGFQPGRDAGGSGLRNMRERAAKLGGNLELTSRPGKGTRIQIAFPV